MHQTPSPRLERSCVDWMRIAPVSDGLERIEAYFCGHGFDPHRHDTYAIGTTTAGVQAFRYRGAARCSLAGQVFVLHPDEIHDGRAGTPAGFRYRILYVEPRLIGAALGQGPLPFWRDVVSENARLARAIVPALRDLDVPLEELQRDAIILDLAEALAAGDAAMRRPAPEHRDIRAVTLAREFLDAHQRATSAELEAVTGTTRYALARHFRACLGTSPYRYLLMRRLDRARGLIRAGVPLADAALRSGFADQSHMTRQFKQAYGLSPGRFAALAA
jgi:AraC-like DNA-binding protein